MINLFYGNGVCAIDGTDIVMVVIAYRGALEIDDKTPDDYFINVMDKSLAITSFDRTGSLSELFEYVGEFKITNAIAVNRNDDSVQVNIKRVMDYSELLKSKAEDLTVVSEDLKSNNVVGRKVAKTILKNPFMENRMTSDRMKLFDNDGNEYQGYYNINLQTKRFMSGAVNDETSINLKTLRNPDVVKAGKKEARARKSRNFSNRTGTANSAFSPQSVPLLSPVPESELAPEPSTLELECFCECKGDFGVGSGIFDMGCFPCSEGMDCENCLDGWSCHDACFFMCAGQGIGGYLHKATCSVDACKLANLPVE